MSFSVIDINVTLSLEDYQIQFSTYVYCSYADRKVRHTYTELFFLKIFYRKYEEPSFIKQMDFVIIMAISPSVNSKITFIS